MNQGTFSDYHTWDMLKDNWNGPILRICGTGVESVRGTGQFNAMHSPLSFKFESTGSRLSKN